MRLPSKDTLSYLKLAAETLLLLLVLPFMLWHVFTAPHDAARARLGVGS